MEGKNGKVRKREKDKGEKRGSKNSSWERNYDKKETKNQKEKGTKRKNKYGKKLE